MTRRTARKTFAVFAGDDRWHVAATGVGPPVVQDAGVPAGADPQAVAEAVAQALGRVGYRGQGVVLGVPSGWCMCAPLAAGSPGRKPTRQSLLFRFEEQLPVPIEDVAADFVGSGDEVLGVCVQAKLVAPHVAALEAAGVSVEFVCPTALLAVQGESAGGVADAWLWGDGDRLDLLRLSDGWPGRWYVLPHRPESLALHLAQPGGGQPAPARVRAVAVPDPLLAAARRLDGVAVHATDGPPILSAAAAAAGQVLSGRLAPWVDLRRDALAPADAYRRFRRPLTFAAAACLAFLACLTAALFWRASHYQRLADRYATEQQAVFARVFPGQPFPATPRSRLASEERKLVGGGAGGAAAGQASALPVLYEALARLPADDVRYRVEMLRAADNRLTIDGQAKSFIDVDALAAALRGRGGFEVRVPRQEQTSGLGGAGAVSFTLIATAPAPALRPSTRPGVSPGAAPAGTASRRAAPDGEDPDADRDADANMDTTDMDADAGTGGANRRAARPRRGRQP